MSHEDPGAREIDLCRFVYCVLHGSNVHSSHVDCAMHYLAVRLHLCGTQMRTVTATVLFSVAPVNHPAPLSMEVHPLCDSATVRLCVRLYDSATVRVRLHATEEAAAAE